MALQIRRGQTRSFGKMIAVSFAVMAIVLQPLVQSNIPAAFAAGEQIRHVADDGVNSGDCLDSSNPCATIMYAVGQADAGDKINIADGNYVEDVTLNKAIKLWGQGSNTKLNGRIRINSGASNSVVHKLYITTTGKDYSLGIFGADNVEVENNSFYGTSITGTSAKAIYVGDKDSDGVVIRNNYIRSVNADTTKGAYGILMNKKNFTNLVIKDNFITALSGHWVHAIGLEGNTPNAQVTGNRVTELTSKTGNVDVHAVFFEDNSSADTVAVNGSFNTKQMTNSTTLTVADKDLVGVAADLEVLTKDGVYRYVGQNAFATAQGAVNAVDTDGTVKLLSDQNVNAPILIKKALTFDGNGLSVVSSLGAGATSQYSGVIEVKGVNSGVVKFVANNNKWLRVHGEGNKAIDGPGPYNGLHGINVYQSNIEINNVNLQNNGKSGLNLGKDSTATVSNLMTNNNMWHGVNVDKGAVLTIKNSSRHNETKTHAGKAVASLYVDAPTSGNAVGIISDENSQYTVVNSYLATGDKAYFLKHEAPKAVVSVGTLNTGDTTTDKNIIITGTATPSSTTGANIKTHFFEVKTPGNKVHSVYSTMTDNRCTLNGANECSFDLGKYYDIDGKYEIRYVVTDQGGIRNDGFGNPEWITGTSQAKFVLYVDATAPAVAVSGASLNDKGTYTINGTTDDLVSPLEVRVDGVLLSGLVLMGYNWSVDTGVLLDGVHTVSVTSVDAAGNTGTDTYSFTTNAGNSIIDTDTNIGIAGTTTGGDNGNRAAAANAADDAAGEVEGVSDAKQGTVEGASTTKNADNADNAAKAGGMAAWFWWILAAAIASFVWWLIAAARKRASDNN